MMKRFIFLTSPMLFFFGISNAQEQKNLSVTSDTGNMYAVMYCRCMDAYYQAALLIKQNELTQLQQTPDNEHYYIMMLANRFMEGIDSASAKSQRLINTIFEDNITAWKAMQGRPDTQVSTIQNNLLDHRIKYDTRARKCMGNRSVELKKLEEQINILLH